MSSQTNNNLEPNHGRLLVFYMQVCASGWLMQSLNAYNSNRNPSSHLNHVRISREISFNDETSCESTSMRGIRRKAIQESHGIPPNNLPILFTFSSSV